MNKRKIKQGAISVLITAGVLALILVANILFTFLANEKLLYIDVSKEKYNEISKESEKELEAVDVKNTDITIYFLADPDELNSPSLGYSKKYTGSTTDLWGMRYVHELALQFAAKYDYVKVDYLSLKDDKDILDRYKTTVGTTMSKQDVIIDNMSQETDSQGNPVKDSQGNPVTHHNFRICHRDAFFTFDEETQYVFAFKGDLRFTSTILSLSGKSPTVYFLTGHGEKVGESGSDDFGKAQGLKELFVSAGFNARKADLAKDYKQIFADSTARILVVFGPDSDYKGRDGEINEIALLRKFAIGENSHLMFFMDDASGKLPNLEEYLWDYCGVGLEPYKIKDSTTNSVSKDGSAFIARYENNPYSVGVNLTNSLTELDSTPRVVFENAGALKFNPAYLQSSGFTEDSSTKFAGAVFLAPSGSYSYDGEGNKLYEYTETFSAPVMSLTYDSWLNNDNDTVATYTTVCGTTDFVDAKYLDDATYANKDVLFLAMRLMGKEDVPFDIDFKVVQSEGLEMDDIQVLIWEICTVAVIPVVMLVLGAVMFFKRRHM